MNMQVLQQVGKKYTKKVPVFKAGATVKVHQKIKEGEKERIQVFEGLVIAINSGSGPDKTFTVRKMVGGIGVEKIFPLYSKNITKITVTKSSDVRRAKLYYMRKRAGKSARLREKHLTEKDIVMEEIEEAQGTEKVEEAKKEEKAEVKEEKLEEKSVEKPSEKPKEELEVQTEAEKQEKEKEKDEK